jgi:hypothetical protein
MHQDFPNENPKARKRGDVYRIQIQIDGKESPVPVTLLKNVSIGLRQNFRVKKLRKK